MRERILSGSAKPRSNRIELSLGTRFFLEIARSVALRDPYFLIESKDSWRLDSIDERVPRSRVEGYLYTRSFIASKCYLVILAYALLSKFQTSHCARVILLSRIPIIKKLISMNRMISKDNLRRKVIVF